MPGGVTRGEALSVLRDRPARRRHVGCEACDTSRLGRGPLGPARGSPPTGSSCTPASGSTTRPRSSATWPASASATCTARPTCRPPRAARTATTWSITAGSTPSSAGPPGTLGWPDGWTRPGWARYSTSCRTTWRSAPGRTPGGGTSWSTGWRAGTRTTSTSTGIRRSPSWRASCSCRCSVTTTGGCWRPASWPSSGGTDRCGSATTTMRHRCRTAPWTSWTATTRARSRRP